MKATDYRYTKDDEIVVNYIYKYGNDLLFTTKKVAEFIGTTTGSISLKIANYKFVNNEGGHSHYTKLTKEINELMKTVCKETQRKMAMKILVKKHQLMKEN